MTKIFLIFLLIFNITSCGKLLRKKESTKSNTTTHSDFQAVIQEFEEKNTAILGFNVDVSHIPINYGKTDDYGKYTVGVCISYSDGSREIFIDADYWSYASETSRYILIAHELGHCYFSLNHNDIMLGNQPLSFMNTFLLTDYNYLSFEHEYDIELATRNPSPLLSLIDPNNDGVYGASILPAKAAHNHSHQRTHEDSYPKILCPMKVVF